jgi:serine/threonine protein kinase
MFSLGCVLLEILAFDRDGSLHRLRPTLPGSNFVYYENLESIDSWLPWSEETDPVRHCLRLEIRNMLMKDPKKRPSADALLRRLRSCHKSTDALQSPIFGHCCQMSTTAGWNPRARAHTLQAGIKDLLTETHRTWGNSFSAFRSGQYVKNIALQQQADETAVLRSETRVETQILSNYDIDAQTKRGMVRRKEKTKPARVQLGPNVSRQPYEVCNP